MTLAGTNCENKKESPTNFGTVTKQLRMPFNLMLWSFRIILKNKKSCFYYAPCFQIKKRKPGLKKIEGFRSYRSTIGGVDTKD